MKVFGCLTAVSYSFEPDWPFASSGSSFVHYHSSCKGLSTNHCRWCVVCLLFCRILSGHVWGNICKYLKATKHDISYTIESYSIHSPATRDRDRLVRQSCCFVTSCLSSKCIWTPNGHFDVWPNRTFSSTQHSLDIFTYCTGAARLPPTTMSTVFKVFFFLILILTLNSSKSSPPCLTSFFCFYVSTSCFILNCQIFLNFLLSDCCPRPDCFHLSPLLVKLGFQVQPQSWQSALMCLFREQCKGNKGNSVKQNTSVEL